MRTQLIEKEDKRIVWLDFVKFIAIFMMIAVHCTDNVTPAERSEPWYNLWGSFYGSFMRPAIPLFVMVTGALLLPVKENISAFYKKRLTRLIVPFIIWSVLYNLFPWITGLLGLSPTVINDFFAWAEPDQSFSGALHNLLMIPFNFSMLAVQMWYVYLLIGLYANFLSMGQTGIAKRTESISISLACFTFHSLFKGISYKRSLGYMLLE